jgi:hypothetical protein
MKMMCLYLQLVPVRSSRVILQLSRNLKWEVDDGTVHVYNNYDHDSMELITSWRALTDYPTTSLGGGLSLDWQRSFSTMIAGGDTSVIKLWNVKHEQCEQVQYTTL